MLYRIYHWLASIPPRIQFKNRDPLTDDERAELAKLLASGYYIILTGNSYHLSSIFVKVMTFLKTGRWTRYSHVLMNCDFMTDPRDVDKFKFMEATVTGVHYSTFNEVFDCDAVCILTPSNMSNEAWTKVIDQLLLYNGRPYDDLFQLSDSTRISCVELVRDALKGDPNYRINFGKLEELIWWEGNLVPHMFRECSDFKVVYENK